MKQPAPKKLDLENVSLEEVEKAIHTRKLNEAAQLLLVCLRRLRPGGLFTGMPPVAPAMEMAFTRLACAIVSLFADPRFTLSPQAYDAFAAEHSAIDAVFRGSLFRSSDFAMPMFAQDFTERDPTKVKFESPNAVAKFLLLYSLNSTLSLKLEKLFPLATRVTLPVWLGMLTNQLLLVETSHARREELLGLGHIFDDAELNDDMLTSLSDAYMYCSYASREDKHEVKHTFNKLLRRLINPYIPEFRFPTPRPIKDRPTILVGVEWFTSYHAMYRCYMPLIKQLKKRFRIVGMGRAMDTDVVARGLFDEWLMVPDVGISLTGEAPVGWRSGIVNRIQELAPDIVYYPSVGMTLWWMALSTVRIAPIQILTPGHPATTNSPVMDYILAEEGTTPKPELFAERIVELPFRSMRYIGRKDWKRPELDLDKRREHPMRIAVPAMASKVTMPFLRMLSVIQAKSPVPLQFHFFPNQLGMLQYVFQREVSAWVNAATHPRYDYQTYMNSIASCAFACSPFPFGGTNSNVDCFLLGVPIIAKRGNELHEALDAEMMRRVRIESLAVDTEEQYVQRALSLITDQELWAKYTQLLLAQNVEQEFFGDAPKGCEDAFLHAVEYLYENHEAIQQSGVRKLTVNDWRKP